MGQWERDVKKVKLVTFQKRIGRKIPAEEDENDYRQLSMTPAAVTKRKYRKGKAYNDYLEELRKMRGR